MLLQYSLTVFRNKTIDKPSTHILKQEQKGRVYMKTSDTYGEPIIMELPNATVRIFRPILTDEERARRMKLIHDAAAELLRAKG